MLAYLGLAAILLILFACAFAMSRFEVLAPAPLAMLMLALATLLACMGTTSWNTIELGWEATSVITLGSLCFTIGSLGFSRLNSSGLLAKIQVPHPTLTARVISLRWLILTAVVIGAIAVRIFETIKMANAAGLGAESFSDMAEWARQETYIVFNTEALLGDGGFSVFERQLEKVVSAAGYISGFSLGALFARRKNSRSLEGIAWPFISLLAACLFGIITGGRSAAMHYLVTIPLAWFIERLRLGEKGISASAKLLTVGIPAGIFAVLVFYAAGALVGREASVNIAQYISFYFGAGIPSLQYRFHLGILRSTNYGERTLTGIYNLLYKTGIMKSFFARGSEFIRLGGLASNINTMFYPYLVDFGFPGVTLLSALAGFIYTFLYEYARDNASSWAYVANYTMLSSGLFDVNRGESLFSAHLSVNHFARIALIYIFVLLLFAPKKITSYVAVLPWFNKRRGDKV